jgi:hypothetical protein
MLIDIVAAPLGLWLLAIFIGLLLPTRWADRLVIAPTWAVPLLLGVSVGVVANTSADRRSALYSWVLPAVVFSFYFVNFWRLPTSGFTGAYRDLLSSHCEVSECAAEMWVTLPLVCSAAYSLGALLRRCARGKPTNLYIRTRE